MVHQRVMLSLVICLLKASVLWSFVATSEAAEAKLSMDSILQGAAEKAKCPGRRIWLTKKLDA